MRTKIIRILVLVFGLHGALHQLSHRYLDREIYNTKRQARHAVLLKFLNDNQI
jgi:hypothetical protein